MKICAACSQTLPKEKFSKKQWQLKCQRRCKECIAENREVDLGAPNDETTPCANGEEAPRYTDEDLFKQPPPRDECPICMLTQPVNESATIYQACCGKILCGGCIHAELTKNNRTICPFCRTPAQASDKETIERIMKRIDANDAEANYALGCYYYDGRMGLRQNRKKANKLWLRAGKLGCSMAYTNIGYAYRYGDGVEIDEKKAKYYYGLAAIGGGVTARCNLGLFEQRAGNMSGAMKHWTISAAAGDDKSLTVIRECFLNGHATKDDFEKALRAHKEAKDEMKSDQREAAAATCGRN